MYCYSLVGRRYSSVDHFHEANTPPDFWLKSPTGIVHIPQNRFEAILRKGLLGASTKTTAFFGYNAELVSVSDKEYGAVFKLQQRPESSSFEPPVLISSRYIVAADGAHSGVRKALGIRNSGISDPPMATLINVHFQCPSLSKQLPDKGMLYFVFNEVCVDLTFFFEADSSIELLGTHCCVCGSRYCG